MGLLGNLGKGLSLVGAFVPGVGPALVTAGGLASALDREAPDALVRFPWFDPFAEREILWGVAPVATDLNASRCLLSPDPAASNFTTSAGKQPVPLSLATFGLRGADTPPALRVLVGEEIAAGTLPTHLEGRHLAEWIGRNAPAGLRPPVQRQRGVRQGSGGVGDGPGWYLRRRIEGVTWSAVNNAGTAPDRAAPVSSARAILEGYRDRIRATSEPTFAHVDLTPWPVRARVEWIEHGADDRMTPGDDPLSWPVHYSDSLEDWRQLRTSRAREAHDRWMVHREYQLAQHAELAERWRSWQVEQDLEERRELALAQLEEEFNATWSDVIDGELEPDDAIEAFRTPEPIPLPPLDTLAGGQLVDVTPNVHTIPGAGSLPLKTDEALPPHNASGVVLLSAGAIVAGLAFLLVRR